MRGAPRPPAGRSGQRAAAKPPQAALRRSRNAARRACVGSRLPERRRFAGVEGKTKIPKAAECGSFCRPREVLIKSGMQIAQIDFSGGVFRLRKICKQDACRDLFSASLVLQRRCAARPDRPQGGRGRGRRRSRRRPHYGEAVMRRAARVWVADCPNGGVSRGLRGKRRYQKPPSAGVFADLGKC